MFVNLNSSQAYKLTKDIHKILNKTIEQSTKPIIAVINGYALGGGLELAMACHIRIASDNAKFGVTFLKIGLIPGDGGAWLLPKIIGFSKAAELLYTGKIINHDTAI